MERISNLMDGTGVNENKQHDYYDEIGPLLNENFTLKQKSNYLIKKLSKMEKEKLNAYASATSQITAADQLLKLEHPFQLKLKKVNKIGRFDETSFAVKSIKSTTSKHNERHSLLNDRINNLLKDIESFNVVSSTLNS